MPEIPTDKEIYFSNRGQGDMQMGLFLIQMPVFQNADTLFNADFVTNCGFKFMKA